MNWIQKLYETYENCQSIIGQIPNNNEVPLLPICHTTQKAQIEIVIDHEGNFKRAGIVSKEDSRTIIPCTEKSGGRTSGEAAHPLCDKLQYVAADYKIYGGDKAHYFASYRDQLQDWNKSEFSHPKAKAVQKYINKGTVIEDLIDVQILFVGSDRKLLNKWDKKIVKNAPDSPQADAFVRWIVEVPNDPQSRVWTDSSLFESWIEYYSSTKKRRSLCYVTGKEIPSADQHPAKLRHDADKAKIISSNDTAGFTFRGRFSTAEEACSVGFEVTQKAHNALRWLISRQGYNKGDQAIVAWATSGKCIPDPLADPLFLFESDSVQSDTFYSTYTAQELAIKLKKKIAGYSTELGSTDKVVIMGIDSATPGRMSITFYRELTGSDFLGRVQNWHESCCWTHNYRSLEVMDRKSGKKKKVTFKFVGAPAPADIAEAAYGAKIDEKLRKATVERILPCIIDKRNIPRDLVESAVRRASKRISTEHREWDKTLSIACALYNKYQEREGFDMALDESRKTRDYLYGRLLAVADSIEEWALNESGENRQTNAARLMQRFSDHPYTTWRTIELALMPYIARLGGKSTKRQHLISQIIAMFEADDYTCDKRLSGEFLLGYHCQREALFIKK